MSLTSEPTTEVTVDGKRLGTTPLKSVAVPAGRRTAVFRNARLGLSRTLRIDVPAGGTATKRVVFGQGKLLLQVRPWADVYLRGAKIGTTPIQPIALYEGSYDLELVNRELKVRRVRRITVHAGQSVKVVEDLQ